jgi:hypothetical protein
MSEIKPSTIERFSGKRISIGILIGNKTGLLSCIWVWITLCPPDWKWHPGRDGYMFSIAYAFWIINVPFFCRLLLLLNDGRLTHKQLRPGHEQTGYAYSLQMECRTTEKMKWLWGRDIHRVE